MAQCKACGGTGARRMMDACGGRGGRAHCPECLGTGKRMSRRKRQRVRDSRSGRNNAGPIIALVLVLLGVAAVFGLMYLRSH